jgi:hypothetical protein
MSDRRSFSEIPPELLRDHGAGERVDRVWQRLSADLAGEPRRRRPVPAVTAAALAAMVAGIFVLGVLVGSRWSSRASASLTAFGAEPPEAPRPASAPALGSPAAPEAAHDAPRARRLRRASGAHRVDAVTPEPEPEAAPQPPLGASLAEWQRLADEGQYAQALAALESGGGFDKALHDATADQLMSLVDVARATGQRDRAIVALRRIVSEHGADPNAPVAAWMLGNELAKIHDAASAEQAFAMYRALSPSGDFAEDALARQVDMAAEQGHGDHARRLAEQYLKEFPDGPRTADIQTELERWSREPSPAASAGREGHELASAGAVDAGILR